MNRVWIGIDNGTSGSIGIITEDGIYKYYHMPIKKELNYTKSKQFLNRIDTIKLIEILKSISLERCFALLERPLVNPGRFRATISAIRALEATLIVFETLKIPYEYIDSRVWQKELLPTELKGPELKIASLQIGKRLFTNINWEKDKFFDADGLLIAEFCHRKKQI